MDEAEENNYKYILFTDASVNNPSAPSGLAATGYVWHERINESHNKHTTTNCNNPNTPSANKEHQWKKLTQGSANIGSGHSSYSAESIAIRLGI